MSCLWRPGGLGEGGQDKAPVQAAQPKANGSGSESSVQSLGFWELGHSKGRTGLQDRDGACCLPAWAMPGTYQKGWAYFSLQMAEVAKTPSLLGSMAQNLQTAYLSTISNVKRVPSAAWGTAGELLQLTPRKAASIAREKVGALGDALRTVTGSMVETLSHYVQVSLSLPLRAPFLRCSVKARHAWPGSAFSGLGPVSSPTSGWSPSLLGILSRAPTHQTHCQSGVPLGHVRDASFSSEWGSLGEGGKGYSLGLWKRWTLGFAYTGHGAEGCPVDAPQSWPPHTQLCQCPSVLICSRPASPVLCPLPPVKPKS